MRIILSTAASAAALVLALVLVAAVVDEAKARCVLAALCSRPAMPCGKKQPRRTLTSPAYTSTRKHTRERSKHQPVKVTSLLANDAVLDRCACAYLTP